MFRVPNSITWLSGNLRPVQSRASWVLGLTGIFVIPILGLTPKVCGFKYVELKLYTNNWLRVQVFKNEYYWETTKRDKLNNHLLDHAIWTYWFETQNSNSNKSFVHVNFLIYVLSVVTWVGENSTTCTKK